jgi:prephenate dehydrogenase
MGSTKSDICAAMSSLPAGVQPVGGHPMCGKETAGFEAAECGLYRNATWVLSPLLRTSPEALALAAELAQAVGARPVVLAAERHDRLVASISHLPFLLASALTAAVADVGADDPTVWELAAGGFRDTSRVAASDTQMFLDILLTNRAAVLEQIDSFDRHLHEVRDLLEDADEARLRAKLSASQRARAEWRKR